MERKNISSGTVWEGFAGYSRAVRLGNIVHVAGTTAVDDAGNLVGGNDAAAQAEFIFQKIERALKQAGAELSDVVRTRVYLTPNAEWRPVAEMHGKYFKDIRPVNTLLYVHALVGDEYLVEIEAEAIIKE